MLTCSVVTTGPEHNNDPGTNLLEYPVQLRFYRLCVPWPCARRGVGRWASHILVHTALLEARLEEDGKTARGHLLRTRLLILFEGLVHGYNHYGGCNPSLGNDQYLD
jgi:hypothetical protein